jgi:hypothetical protein
LWNWNRSAFSSATFPSETQRPRHNAGQDAALSRESIF